MIPFQFVPRGYVHFDAPISKAVAEALATSPEGVTRHAFFPFIEHHIETCKIGKDANGKVYLKPPKVRPIAYAAHQDSHIFSHYSDLWMDVYTRKVHELGLHEVVTAFRALDRKRNIHFANEVFEYIRKSDSSVAIAMDISDFFGAIRHDVLKRNLVKLHGDARLPLDHLRVFKAVTEYTVVDRDALYARLGIDHDGTRGKGPRRLCSAKTFREEVRGGRLCWINRSGVGIVQGSPISAVFSNIYMVDFDAAVHARVQAVGGFYRRYCDDILIVVSTVEEADELKKFVLAELTAIGLSAHPEKTETVEFIRSGERLVTKTGKPLTYLGFTFDGEHKRIKSASIARFYRNMRRGVGRARALRYQYHQKHRGAWPAMRKRKLYIQYSYLGRRNFLTYAFDAARIMGDPGIKKQVKGHWRKLQELLMGKTA